ncbi:hypothetical protein SDC9_146850 [bioreactor metagenome]|uniref:Uncharacterized protein n=1 Tax=bioreactor metagenome TaxID=1076179 RepID=A0A645ECF2_9ZZZZ
MSNEQADAGNPARRSRIQHFKDLQGLVRHHPAGVPLGHRLFHFGDDRLSRLGRNRLRIFGNGRQSSLPQLGRNAAHPIIHWDAQEHRNPEESQNLGVGQHTHGKQSDRSQDPEHHVKDVMP